MRTEERRQKAGGGGGAGFKQHPRRWDAALPWRPVALPGA